MGENSKIEWTHHTFNPWEGCTKISPGCANCYAEARAQRFQTVKWGPQGTRRIASEAYWRQPLKWDSAAKAAGERRRVFCASLADVFEEWPELVEPRQRLFQLIGQTPHLDWLLLTKRPEVAVQHWPLWCGYWAAMQTDVSLVRRVSQDYILPNVWLGVSVENQQYADERIPHLLRTPAAVRFLSCEPLLGLVDIFAPVKPPTRKVMPSGERCWECDAIVGWRQGGILHPCGHAEPPCFDWVIVGGESGKDARPCHIEWIRDLVWQCKEAGVACFVKQLGSKPYHQVRVGDESPTNDPLILKDSKGGDPASWPADLRVREFPSV